MPGAYSILKADFVSALADYAQQFTPSATPATVEDAAKEDEMWEEVSEASFTGISREWLIYLKRTFTIKRKI